MHQPPVRYSLNWQQVRHWKFDAAMKKSTVLLGSIAPMQLIRRSKMPEFIYLQNIISIGKESIGSN